MECSVFVNRALCTSPSLLPVSCPPLYEYTFHATEGKGTFSYPWKNIGEGKERERWKVMSLLP